MTYHRTTHVLSQRSLTASHHTGNTREVDQEEPGFERLNGSIAIQHWHQLGKGSKCSRVVLSDVNV